MFRLTSRYQPLMRDQPGQIRPREACSFHPVLCTYIGEDEIGSISLTDAAAPCDGFRALGPETWPQAETDIDDIAARFATHPDYPALGLPSQG